MSNIFLTSDTHFGHHGICKFIRADGVTKERPWDTIEEMDEALVANWNSVVRPNDKVYHLGDVIINRRAFATLERLNGDKVLIKGNHDLFKLEEYSKYFRDIRGFGTIYGFALTHVPIHPDSLGRWKGNWHGHLHSNVVKLPNGEIDSRYMCLCVEQTNFAPISFEDAKLRFERQQCET